MSTENVELISALYNAFARGDVASVLAPMSPDIHWMEAENCPYADGNPYIGPDAVMNGIFARCVSEFDDYSVTVEEIIDAGDTIVVLARYGGTFKATGRTQHTQVVHIWRIKDSKITAFQQYVDTLQMAQVRSD